ncbi:hypothetical protein GCM10010519_17250 [Streptomyces lactacystinicus]
MDPVLRVGAAIGPDGHPPVLRDGARDGAVLRVAPAPADRAGVLRVVVGLVVGAGAGVDIPASGSARAQLTVVSINDPAWQSS